MIFYEINNELHAYLTIPIIKKICIQMNYCFFYYATQIERDKLVNKDLDVSYEIKYINEVFDLS